VAAAFRFQAAETGTARSSRPILLTGKLRRISRPNLVLATDDD